MFKSDFFGITISATRLLVFGLGLALCDLSYAQSAPDPTAYLRAYKARKQVQSVWKQRGQKKVARLLIPFANDPSLGAQYAAIRMLGRLEDPVALSTLQKLTKRPMDRLPLDAEPSEGLIGLYPLVPLAIGRIKSRNLSGKRKIETAIREMRLDFPALVQLSKRLNRDGYGPFRVGYPVLEEVVDILYRQKKRGIAVDSIIRALTLRPAQRALLSAAALPAPQQSKALLAYLAQARIAGGDELDVVAYWEELGAPGRVGALPIIKQVLQKPKRKVSPWNMVTVLESMARSGDKSALALLKTLARNQREFVGVLAQRSLDNLK